MQIYTHYQVEARCEVRLVGAVGAVGIEAEARQHTRNMGSAA
jgi:hypothetical protein